MKLENINKLVDTVKNGTRADIAKLINEEFECYTTEEINAMNSKSFEDAEENSYKYEKEGNNFKTLDIATLTKSVKKSLTKIPSREEARYISDIYYQIQTMRIGVESQLRAMDQRTDQDSKTEIAEKSTKSNPVQSRPFMEWYLFNLKIMETEIGKALAIFSDSCYMGRWAKANKGIGPTIATQLIAYLNIPSDTGFYAGNWWSYCGLNDNNRPWLGREKSNQIVNKHITDPKNITDQQVMELAAESKWQYSYYEENGRSESGAWSKEMLIKATAKIPYNTHMKVLMYKIGHQFVFVKNKSDSVYGKIYKERLAYETAKNENGDYAEQAAKILASKNFNKSTEAYKSYSIGKLPPAHLSQRAQRYATKMFISHLFEAEYYNKFGKSAPNPYMLAVEGHKGYVEPEVPYTTFERDGI